MRISPPGASCVRHVLKALGVVCETVVMHDRAVGADQNDPVNRGLQPDDVGASSTGSTACGHENPRHVGGHGHRHKGAPGARTAATWTGVSSLGPGMATTAAIMTRWAPSSCHLRCRLQRNGPVLPTIGGGSSAEVGNVGLHKRIPPDRHAPVTSLQPGCN